MNLILQNLPDFLIGARNTLIYCAASFPLALLIGLILALMKTSRFTWLNTPAKIFIEVVRSTPIITQLFLVYYGLGAVLANYDLAYLLNAWVAGITVLALNYAAYEAEIYRNGIQAVPIGQWEAGASLGMSPLLTFRRIIFPQSIRVILPPMTNDFIALFKDTSVVSIISVVELSKQYQILTKSYGGFLEIGLTTAALYLVMSVPLGYLSRYLEKRWGAK